MDRKARVVRIFRWVSLTLLGVVVLAWGVSTQYCLSYARPGFYVEIEAGQITVGTIRDIVKPTGLTCGRPVTGLNEVFVFPWARQYEDYVLRADIARSPAVFYHGPLARSGAVDEYGNPLSIAYVYPKPGEDGFRNDFLATYADGRQKAVRDTGGGALVDDGSGHLVGGGLMVPAGKSAEDCLEFHYHSQTIVQFWFQAALAALPFVVLWRRELAGLAAQLIGRARRKSRIRLALKRVGVVVALMVLAAWTISYEWDVSRTWSTVSPPVSYQIASDFGGVCVSKSSTDLSPEGLKQLLTDEGSNSYHWLTPTGWRSKRVKIYLSMVRFSPPPLPMLCSYSERNPCAKGCAYGHGDACLVKGGTFRVTGFWLPFWLPFLLVAFGTGWLFWTDRPPRKGLCHECGYDLTGNTSGRCPECGEPIQPPLLPNQTSASPAA